MYTRDSHHYLCVDKFTSKKTKKYLPGETVLVLSPEYYGLKGVIEEEKGHKSNVKINSEEESKKIRNFDFAADIFRKAKINSKFMSSKEVAKFAKCHVTTINRITSSVVIKYPFGNGNLTKKIDIGLKVRNSKD